MTARVWPRPQRRPPRPQDLDLIQAFASQAAVAIENARHVDAAVRRSRRERLLNEIMDTVREPTEVGEMTKLPSVLRPFEPVL